MAELQCAIHVDIHGRPFRLMVICRPRAECDYFKIPRPVGECRPDCKKDPKHSNPKPISKTLLASAS